MPNKFSITRKNKQTTAVTRQPEKVLDGEVDSAAARAERLLARVSLAQTTNLRIIPKTDIESLYITDKAKNPRPFRFWSHQNKILAEVNRMVRKKQPVRIQKCKPRQCGGSTVFTLITYYLVTRFNLQATVIGHKKQSSYNLFKMIETAFLRDPYFLNMEKRALQWRDGDMIQFPGGGRIIIATAGSKAAVTSTTNQIVLATEHALWEGNVADQMKSLLNTVSNTHPFTFVFIESTPRPGTDFRDRWYQATSKGSAYTAMFTSWPEIAEYTMPITSAYEEMQLKTDLDEHEKYLMSAYDCTLEQIKWRRYTIANNCSGSSYEARVLHFNSEYPLTPEIGFQASEVSVFDNNILERMNSDAIPPVFQGDVLVYERGEGFNYSALQEDIRLRNRTFIPSPNGCFRVWKWPEPGKQYVAGVDVSEGLQLEDSKTDDSAICIREHKTGEVVAFWVGKMPPDDLADLITLLGFFYNVFYVCVENNNMGIATTLKLWKQYPKYAQYRAKIGIHQEQTERIGYRTSWKNKPPLLVKLSAAIRNEEFLCNDRETLQEMLNATSDIHGKVDTNGKDRLMASALSEEARMDNPMYAYPKPKKTDEPIEKFIAWEKNLQKEIKWQKQIGHIAMKAWSANN